MDPLHIDDFLDIIYRSDLDVLVARWLRPINVSEMRRGYDALLTEALKGYHQRWLLDVRRRRNTHLVGAQWMMSTFLPQLGPRLGGHTRLAYLLSPEYLRDEAADAAFPPPGYFAGQPFVADRFIEEQAAIGWLLAAAGRE